MEGVMMRGSSAMATAVRDADGIIRVESKRITPVKKRNICFRLPFVRGVLNFFDSFVTGTKILMRSAEVYGEGEPSKFEKWLSEKLHLNLMSVVTTIATILGVLLAVGLFVVLPQVITGAMERAGWIHKGIAYNFIEGGIRIAIFIVYLLLVSLIKDIKRTFRYHGAEHMTISCYEKGMDLTVENAKKCSRVHNRCGTTFLFFVMVVSILVFSLANYQGGKFIVKLAIKIALLPVVAGISYEILKLLAKTDFFLFYPFKLPGLLLQRITTATPDDEMLEVAITAFKTVQEMDANPEIPEKEFIISMLRNKLVEETEKTLAAAGIDEKAEAEWIVALTIGVPRSEVREEKLVNPKYVEKVREITKERASGRPLWYVIGNTDFYGYTITVNENVLIPRPETEELCEYALSVIQKEDKVLDLCTGSGAIAVVLADKAQCDVTAVDVSEEALAVAKQNAENNGVTVKTVQSNLFENLQGEVFDVIVTNPPYIKTGDLSGLAREVKDFEPTLALDGGEDGLDFYRLICREAPKYLTKNGVLFMEFGIGQAKEICTMLEDVFDVEIKSDFNGRERMIKAVKKC